MNSTTITDDSKVRQKAIKRAAFRTIWLPFIVGFVFVVVLVVVAATLPDARQTSLLANFLLTILILCPMALCMLPIYLVVVAAIYGMTSANKHAAKPLIVLERTTAKVAARTHDIGVKVAKASITFNVKMTSVDRAVFSIFDRPRRKRRTHEQPTTDDAE
jgi:predicted PurR-regulated permease PerM